MKEFYCKTRIYSGDGALSALKQLCRQRVMIVADPFFVKNGTAERLACLSAAQETIVYSEIAPDPTAEQVAQATAVMQQFKPDTVVALGGGSAMDCAKAMVYFSGAQVRLIAVPTTSGSGSEVTDFAIVTHQGIKHPLIDEKLRPDAAILDSTLLKELPPALIADTGFDVLAHALEAYVATNAGSITDALAQAAFCVAVRQLPLSCTGCVNARMPMHEASTMAAMAFSGAGLGLCHAMSHTLGGMFHLPHGRLNAILLPAVISVNTGAAGAKYAQMAQMAGFGGTAASIAVRNLKNGLIQLRKTLNLPGSLTQAGLDANTVWRASDRIVQATLNDPCCATNPARVEGFTVRRVLEEVIGRG